MGIGIPLGGRGGAKYEDLECQAEELGFESPGGGKLLEHLNWHIRVGLVIPRKLLACGQCWRLGDHSAGTVRVKNLDFTPAPWLPSSVSLGK